MTPSDRLVVTVTQPAIGEMGCSDFSLTVTGRRDTEAIRAWHCRAFKLCGNLKLEGFMMVGLGSSPRRAQEIDRPGCHGPRGLRT